MLHTLRMDRDIPLNRRVEFVLPDDFPTGEAEVVLVVVPKDGKKKRSVHELATSELVGMWKGREDRPSTTEEFIAWRRQVWLGHDE